MDEAGPGQHVGGPEPVAKLLAQLVRHLVRRAPGRVEQEALALMLESGDFDRDVRRLRDAFASTPVATPDAPRPRASVPGWSGSSIRLRNRP